MMNVAAAQHFVRAPGWTWYILFYFFFAGLAGGSYAIATLLRLYGDPSDEPMARLGYYVAFPAYVICPILLTVDLWQPQRFWHMLRRNGADGQSVRAGVLGPLSAQNHLKMRDSVAVFIAVHAVEAPRPHLAVPRARVLAQRALLVADRAEERPVEPSAEGDLVVRPVAVDLRAERAAGGEARDLPQLGEEVVDLAAQPVDVAPARHGSQRTAAPCSRRPPPRLSHSLQSRHWLETPPTYRRWMRILVAGIPTTRILNFQPYERLLEWTGSEI